MILRSSVIISVITLISRIFGYFREIMMATVLGTGPVANAFHIAFRFSNVFRSFFAEGAFTASFVPIFTTKYKEDKDIAINYASKVQAMLISFLTIFTIIIEIFMPQIMVYLAPGFTSNDHLMELSIIMARITFPYLIFMSISTLYGGMLGTKDRFSTVAAAPILLNISMLIALVIGHENIESIGKMLCVSIVVSGILQLILVYKSASKYGLKLKLAKPVFDKDTRFFLKSLFPGIMSASVVQINLWISTIIATFYDSAVSLLYYADRVVQLPLSLIGTSVGMVLLPAFSKYKAPEDAEKSNNIKNRTLEFTMFLCIPTAFIMMVLSHEVIVATFQYGAFSISDSEKTGILLMIFATALPFFILNKIFTPCFHAVYDTKTPFHIAAASLFVNAISNYLFLLYHPFYYGIAISTAISSFFNSITLGVVSIKRGLYIPDKIMKFRIFKIICAVIILYIYHYFIGYIEFLSLIIPDTLINVFIYYMIYLASAFAMKIYKISEIKGLVAKNNH